jgi:hypothetical protein
MVTVIRTPGMEENMQIQRKISPLGVASIAAVTLVAALAAAVGSPDAASIQPPPWALHGTYAPSIEPANFVAKIDNPYFSLKPGTSFHYQGFKGSVRQRDDMVVTHQTR